MKKTLSKVLALILAVALVLPTLPTSFSAATWDNVPETTYASRYTTSDYTTGKFYDNMTKIPLTGDGARDVVAVAASQMGYVEGDSSAGLDGETGGSSNYTEYGYYMGITAAWCAAFCSWCFYTAEVTDVDGYYYYTEDGNIWADVYVPAWSTYLINQGRYRYAYYAQNSLGYGTSQAFYVPQPGDLVFFNTSYAEDYPGYEGHIGLVAYSDGEYVYTLEGNTSSQEGVESEGGGAFFKSYSLYDDSLMGFGVMPYETVAGLPEIDYSGNNPTPGLYVNPSGAKSVYLDKEDDVASWTLPMSSVFEVLAIDEDSLGNTMLYSKCEINGETIYGWIVNGSDSGTSALRTLQIYAAPVYDESVDANRDGIPDSYNPSKDASGDYTFENVYGYEFDIDGVDGVIGGEDAYIITTDDAYAACNPNWAISVQLRPTGNAEEYSVVRVAITPGSADAAGIALQDGDIVMVVHSAGSQPGYSNWMAKVAALTLEAGDIVKVASDYSSVTVPEAGGSEDPDEPDVPVDPDEPDVPVDPDEPDVPVDPDEPIVPDEPEDPVVSETIKYQTNKNSTDVRLVAYVDDLAAYSKVAFSLTIGDKTSKELVCTTAYNGLYADGNLYTTEQIYGVDGYFVTYTIGRYLDVYAGVEVTINVTYTKVTGETVTDSRTVTIGTKAEEEEPEEPVVPDEPVVIESGSIGYANGYDWTNMSDQIYVFASSDATATPASIHGQGAGFMGWFTGIVLEYNSTNDTWVVTDVCLPDGTNEAESETLGSNKMVIAFHSDAANGHADAYNFFTKYAVVGTELYLSGSVSKIQSTGSLSGVSLATGKVESNTPTTEYNYGGAIGGAGLQGYTDNLYYGCDLSFYNVGDNSYANGSSLTDSGADYSLVDFEAMKADGCDFVILRIGSEDSSGKYYDPHFVTYYNMAREAGLDIGVYYYSYALTYAEAAEEAEFVIEVMEDHGMYFEYPIYIDIEDSDQLALGETALSNVCYGWCETMVEAGYFPGIYGNYNLYDGISTQVKADYDFWLAYVSAADTMSTYNPSNTNVSAECGVWQYSFYGYEYDGIGLDMLDVNVSYKDYPAIMEAYGYNNVN